MALGWENRLGLVEGLYTVSLQYLTGYGATARGVATSPISPRYSDFKVKFQRSE